MSPRPHAIAFGLAMLAGGASLAGEILINESSSAKRNEQAARQLGERARQQTTGQAGAEGAVYVLDPATGQLVPAIEPSQAERMRREARNRIDPAAADTAGDGAPVIFAAPLSEAERLRLKARAYAPPAPKNTPRHCGTASNSVGTIGEGAGAHKSENVVEKGGEAVNTNCR